MTVQMEPYVAMSRLPFDERPRRRMSYCSTPAVSSCSTAPVSRSRSRVEMAAGEHCGTLAQASHVPPVIAGFRLYADDSELRRVVGERRESAQHEPYEPFVESAASLVAADRCARVLRRARQRRNCLLPRRAWRARCRPGRLSSDPFGDRTHRSPARPSAHLTVAQGLLAQAQGVLAHAGPALRPGG